jgi:hypothetical protein
MSQSHRPNLHEHPQIHCPSTPPFTDHESQLSPVDRSRTRWRRPPGRTREHYRDNTSEEALATDHPRSSTSEEAFAPRRDGDPTRARAAPPRLCLTDQWPQQQDDAAPNRLNEGRRHPAMRGHRNSQNAAQAERRRPTHNLYPQISPRGARIWAKGGRIHGSEGAAVREGGRNLRRKKGEGGGGAMTRPVVRPAAAIPQQRRRRRPGEHSPWLTAALAGHAASPPSRL